MEHFVTKFLNTVNNHNNEPAISDEFGTFTYAKLLDYGKTIAANLQAKGVKRGNRVTIELPKSKEYAGCLIGCWLIGVVTIPLSDNYPEDRLEYIKKDSQYELSIDELFLKNLDTSLKAEPIIADMEDESVLMYTSGSTGNPKGVIHDFYSMAAAADRDTVNAQANVTQRNNIEGLVAPFTFIIGLGEFIAAVSLAKHMVLVSDETRKDPMKLAKYFDDNNIQSSFVPPRMVDFVLEHNKSLKVISVGTERITNIYYGDHPAFVNGYGTTELFGGLIAFQIDKKYENTPIGKPFGNEKAYVLDDNNNEVEIGELCISGYIAKGYLNCEKETKKVFIKNPFKNIDGFDRMFRTGDIVQRLPDGNLVFLNRKDWMIKINGQRVEPLEVESTIRKIKGIKEAVVKDFTAKNGITYLVAYYVCDKDITQEQIQEFCKSNLTSYMVPSFYIHMDALPLNSSGKLNRFMLPEPDISTFKTEYIAPENKIEEAVCSAIETVLKCGKVGRNDDFFLLGGDSIKAMEAISILDNLPINTETFFKGRTPEKIAEMIENSDSEEIRFEKVEKAEYPLTSSQLGIYLEITKNPEKLMYNNPVKIKLDPEIDTDRLIDAIDKAVNNHKAYHCSIEVRNGFPCMVPNDWLFHTERKQSNIIEESLNEFVQPFDLENGVLIDEEIIPTGKLAADTDYMILDENDNPVGDNEAGELLVSNERMSHHYLNLPEQTAKTCIEKDGKLWFRTRDRVKRTPDGIFTILGRTDNMIKLRGFRIETGEVEQQISKAVENIKAEAKNIVVVLKTVNGIDHLACYYEGTQELNVDAIIGEISFTLAPYMIPDIWVRMDSMPRNANGKILRKELPEPKRHESKRQALLNKKEARIVETAASVLGITGYVSPEDGFAELGGTSAKAMEFTAKLHDIGITVSSADILKLNTLRKIAEASHIFSIKDIYGYSNNGNKKIVFVHTGNTGSEAYYSLAKRIKNDFSFAVIEPYNLYHPYTAKYGRKKIAKYMYAAANRHYFETCYLFEEMRKHGMLETLIKNSENIKKDMIEHVPSHYDGKCLYFKPKVILEAASGGAKKYWDLMMDKVSLDIIVPEMYSSLLQNSI